MGLLPPLDRHAKPCHHHEPLPEMLSIQRLPILQCLDHQLCLSHHVLSMRLDNVLACLVLNLLDKGTQQIDGCSGLTINLCRLGCTEFGQ